MQEFSIDEGCNSKATLKRLNMTFVLPTNGKNSTSAVCHLAFVTEMSRFVFVVDV